MTNAKSPDLEEYAAELVKAITASGGALVFPPPRSSLQGVKAARILGKSGDAAAAKPLIAALLKGDFHLQEAAKETLAALGPLATEQLMQIFQSNWGVRDDGSKREKLACVLGMIKDPRTVEPLIVSLQDSEIWKRAAAAKALGDIGDARAVAPLIGMLLTNTQLMVSEINAVVALGQLGHRDAVDPLLALLKDRVKMSTGPGLQRVGPLVMQALGKLGDSRAVPALLDELNSPPTNKFVRSSSGDIQSPWVIAAASALGQIGDARAAGDLMKLAIRDEHVSAAAIQELCQLLRKAAAGVTAEVLREIAQLPELQAIFYGSGSDDEGSTYSPTVGSANSGAARELAGQELLRREREPLPHSPSAEPAKFLESTCKCGKMGRIKSEYAGKRVKCPKCGQVLTAPAASG